MFSNKGHNYTTTKGTTFNIQHREMLKTTTRQTHYFTTRTISREGVILNWMSPSYLEIIFPLANVLHERRKCWLYQSKKNNWCPVQQCSANCKHKKRNHWHVAPSGGQSGYYRIRSVSGFVADIIAHITYMELFRLQNSWVVRKRLGIFR